MSSRHRRNAVAMVLLGVGFGVWFWQSNAGPAPSPGDSIGGSSEDATGGEQPAPAAGSVEHHERRVNAGGNDGSPTNPQDSVPEWLSGATLLPGGLSAAEVEVALGYVGALMDSAASELEKFDVDPESGEDLAEQARMVREIELWRAVDRSLRRGDFRVASSVPGDLRAPSGVQMQLFPTWKDGESVTLIFEFEISEEPGLFDANSYEAQMKAFRDSDAAWRFNQLPYEDRKRKLESYRRHLAETDWQELPEHLRHDFPLHTYVEEGTLLMVVSR